MWVSPILQATKALRVSRGIALLFSRTSALDGGGDQPHARAASTPGKDPVPIVQQVVWAQGPVRTGGKSRPHRDSIPNRPGEMYLFFKRVRVYRARFERFRSVYCRVGYSLTHTHTHTHQTTQLHIPADSNFEEGIRISISVLL